MGNQWANCTYNCMSFLIYFNFQKTDRQRDMMIPIYMYLLQNFVGNRENSGGGGDYQNDAEQENFNLISSAHHDRVVKLPGTRFGIFPFWFSLQCLKAFSFFAFLVNKKEITFRFLKKYLISELKRVWWLWHHIKTMLISLKRWALYTCKKI